MRHQGALGRAGRARGKHDHADIAVGDRHQNFIGGTGEYFVEAAYLDMLEIRQGIGVIRIAGHIDGLQIGHAVFDIGQPGQIFRFENSDARPGIGQHMGEETALQGGVDADMNRADPAQANPGPQIFQAVVQHHRHIVAPAHADAGETIAHPIGQFMGPGIAVHGSVFELNKRCIAARPRLVGQYLADHPIGLIGGHNTKERR